MKFNRLTFINKGGYNFVKICIILHPEKQTSHYHQLCTHTATTDRQMLSIAF